MTFEFDTPRRRGSNLAAKATDCQTCGGHRMIPVDTGDGYEAHARCPVCNPEPSTAPKPQATQRERRWWQE